jgi:hypothetical protein
MNRFAITLGLAVAVASSLSLSGCSQEDYYCDGTGCYYCDGVGCRSVEPPGRQTCSCNRDCPTGSVCTSLGCTIECSAGGTCLNGTQCRGDQYCLGPLETAPTADIACVCTTAADCDAFEHAGETLECRDGECVPSTGPVLCGSDAACAAGYECVDGTCRAPSATCQFSSECGPGRVCVNQTCTTSCGAGPSCPTGAFCGADGFCHPSPPAGCTTSAMCASGQICIDGQCWNSCTSDAMCPTGFYCAADMRCRYDDRPRSACPCASGSVCVGNVCRSPCSTPTDCRRFDEQLTACIEMLCFTTNEATSDCDEQSDCSAGQNCVDGTCRTP